MGLTAKGVAVGLVGSRYHEVVECASNGGILEQGILDQKADA